MNDQLKAASDFINQKSLRERVIILLVAVVLVYGVCDLLFFAGLQDARAKKSQLLSTLVSTNEQKQLQINNITVAKKNTGQSQTRQRELLQQKLQGIDAELSSAASGFIPADLMPQMLEQMLGSQDKLQLLAMENIPAVELTSRLEDNADKSAKAALFRHGVKLELQGSYMSALRYLQTLESLSWRFDWHALDFEIAEYPAGKLTLEVFTYSTEKQWLGV